MQTANNGSGWEGGRHISPHSGYSVSLRTFACTLGKTQSGLKAYHELQAEILTRN